MNEQATEWVEVLQDLSYVDIQARLNKVSAGLATDEDARAILCYIDHLRAQLSTARQAPSIVIKKTWE